MNAKHLQTHQTVLLIQRGLSDSSPAVVDACRVMLCTRWLRDAGDDPVQLLALLDVVNHEVGERGAGGGGVLMFCVAWSFHH